MRGLDTQASGRSTVAILGARGFIGRAVVAAFEAHGIPTVRRGSRLPAVREGRLDPEVAAADTVVVVTGRSNPALAELQPSTAERELAESRQLFDLLAHGRPDASPVQRVLMASSGGSLYDTQVPPPYSESAPTARSGAYAALKLDLEECFLEGATRDSHRTVLRLSNVYGPGQRIGTGQGVVGHWFHALAEGGPLRLFGDPETIRDYVYVDDVAAAFAAAHHAGRDLPPVLNVGSGQPTSLRELVDLILQAADLPAHPVQLVPDRPFDRRHTWLDVSAARATLGWTPNTGLADGLRRTWRQLIGNPAPYRVPVESDRH